ncbi:hypothetical protein BDV38DRAFT_249102 [Aspergillus pseudotamarii]|uniref:Uncharacterized protein n=1 Tax=Aspergillus pseudotamarii TaxID=132259 RepID=A0A5N6STP3_ASPPS|nr:uncharacterized protein BDV38DRAFT_249102 [Aspergillus pseudotamarii]KAE8136763.1 hypothetical protein BDV38DRAFT_249102 [Aspergillus pseudotamarii]
MASRFSCRASEKSNSFPRRYTRIHKCLTKDSISGYLCSRKRDLIAVCQRVNVSWLYSPSSLSASPKLYVIFPQSFSLKKFNPTGPSLEQKLLERLEIARLAECSELKSKVDECQKFVAMGIRRWSTASFLSRRFLMIPCSFSRRFSWSMRINLLESLTE